MHNGKRERVFELPKEDTTLERTGWRKRKRQTSRDTDNLYCEMI